MTRLMTSALRSTVLLSVIAVAGCGVGNPEEPVVTDEVLSFDDEALKTGNEIRGSFARAGSLITFSSRLTGPSRAVLQVKVNGKTLTSTIDIAAQTSNWNGYNAAFSLEDREALIALANQLESRFSAERPAPHERLLVRRIMYWSEAPVGATLPNSDTPAPAERESDGKEAPGTVVHEESEDGTIVQKGVVDETGTSITAAPANGLQGAETDQTCQRGDNDGITYISSSNVYRYLSHDASSHCFLTEYVKTGCSSNCLGRCGSGCGLLGGWGVWSLDCADHDRSCRVHGGCTNPWDSSTGDEFREADDDYVWGWPKNKC